MPHKNTFEIIAVWVMTGIGNIIAQSVGLLDYLPIIKDIVGIISILLAIAYTAYMFKKNWDGWNPRKKK